ncbi:toxin [Pseudenhygromyxa sp. WMMC2535]|uniref:SpvB/TcaC N-terminal domain-containing protein n=1 Tax=Pseudenhygromyxa sp. WMMC2535 TaxID=2712867 RepID=UPI0015551B14|nr:SpvB/TcaC N-terminal domain-containing protein [Pseudenhygromyxa sp. WMMC2535]NVB39974.1 toxin [Pseudenhygromyxa sp. WMMC2535]
MTDDSKQRGPGMTAGPSLPIHGPQPSQPFNAGLTPGRDAPGAGPQSKDDQNPFADSLRSPYGDQANAGEGQSPTASFSPAISLPTGGGALRSIGEKFSANPFTGSGSMSVPIACSPGRGGFGPELALRYGSGQGNGPFGLGWLLGVPAISRKTEKGLPEYRDEHPDLSQRDTFILAGVEDLVHALDDQGEAWEQTRDGHRIHRFHPRVEGGFSRIERWTSLTTGETHWRTISPANVTSVFGKTSAARIADPLDSARVFSWLLEESHDDRGNIIVYQYKQEDLAGVDQGTPAERPRLEQTLVQSQRYLERIYYGNTTPFQAGDWLFELVLDYGEYDTPELTNTPARPWPVRLDTFSTYRAGFELRTRRLCRRVLMFHHFDELGPAPTLVASTDFVHDEDPALTRLVGVIQRSYLRDEQTGNYDLAQLPTLEFDYSQASLDPTLHELDDPATLQNLPAGIDGRLHRLVDLDGEGLPGVISEQAGHWYFKRGLGDGQFGPMVALPAQPTTAGFAGAQLIDLDGDGCKELVHFVAPTPGFFKRVANEGWTNFRRFSAIPNIDWSDPGLQLVDLSGDGFPDLLLDRGDHFAWYRSKGPEGFDAPRRLPNPRDERSKPVLLFLDARAAIQLADMTGDGLLDIVRVRDGELAYWPNTGHGRFGPMLRMPGLAPFCPRDLFDPARLRFADVDGSGTTDLLYLHERGASLHRNLAGNAFAPAEPIERFPGMRSVDWAEVVDLRGSGTACLLWSSALPAGRGPRLRYIDLMGAQKPHLLVASRNNMGAETRIAYAPSTKFYLADARAGQPWATKLPFPVHVIERVEAIDHVARQRFVQRYAYHHGCFDGQEREFRGFGMVETWDTESFDDFTHDGLFTFDQFDTVEHNLHQPPVHTKQWFHTGAFIERARISTAFADEYWRGDADAFVLPDTALPADLSGPERREALRALAGSSLRTEVYALDGSALEPIPYTVSEANFAVRQLQPAGPNRNGVYQTHGRETLSVHYERDVDDPRLAHGFVLEVDDYGTVLRGAEVVYPRRSPAHAEQAALHVTLSEAAVVHLDDLDAALRLAVPVESRSYELHGLALDGAAAFSWQALRDAADTAVAIAPTAAPTGVGALEKRLLGRSRTLYLADDLSAPLAHGTVESKALVHETQTLAMTEAQRQAVFSSLTGAPSDTELETEGGYLHQEGDWWLRSGHPTYAPDKFFQITAVEDPFENVYTTTYDAHALLTLSSTDPLGNTLTAAHDYRLLAPWQLTDPNGNRSQVAFDVRGFVIASAVMGKAGDSDGDTLEDPTATFEYDLFSWVTTGKPNWAKSRARETHQDPSTRWLEQRTYFSGAGAVVMTKAQARPGLAPQRDQNGQLVLDGEGQLVMQDTSPDLRWVGNGRVIRDNKGNPLKAYEPYFSSTPDYEDEAELVEQGVTALNHYDPLGRLIRTDLPNGTFSYVEFDPWQQTSFDPNDTVLDSAWFSQRIDYAGSDAGLLEEKRAAQLAAAHANTPSLVHLDTLGRPFLSVAHNKTTANEDEYIETRSVLDIQGKVLALIDARGNTAEARTYGMLGQSLRVTSVDAGDRWHLRNALGQPMRVWDSRDQRFSFSYDALRRPTDRTVSVAGGPEKLLTRILYGEQLDTPTLTNHRTHVYRAYDGAGVATTDAFDFKGHPTSEQRQLVSQKTSQPDWSPLLGISTIPAMATAAAPLLDAEVFSASSTRDALGRTLTALSPDGSEVTYGYDQGGNLQRVTLRHRGADSLDTIVGDIAYDAKGQRQSITHGPIDAPTSTTAYTYDPLTFRLQRLTTTRASDQALLQSLHYHYDPAGNITDVRDAAQQTLYFQNTVVQAANSYTYDALYRLIEATGREHASDGTAQRTHDQLPVGPQPMTTDPSAMRRYTQRYTYDVVGNILAVQHLPSAGTGWTRRYQYAEDGNRLLATSAPGDAQDVYTHDAHGSMTTMPHLAAMVWNHDDQLEQATAGTTTVHFQYAGGSRARKYTQHAGATSEERIYLGPFELYRKRVNGDLDLERESLHVSDGTGRICLIETKTVSDGATIQDPLPIWRYQLGNHLGSAAIELTRAGQVISYEEYHPYGTSAYRALDAAIDVSPKRYRYTGMERDEETGLAYHTARYYAPWLGRWTAADPIGLSSGPNRYQYATSSPVSLSDLEGCQTPAEKLTQFQNQIRQAESTRHRIEQNIAQAVSIGDFRTAEQAQIDLHEQDITLGKLRQFEAQTKQEINEAPGITSANNMMSLMRASTDAKNNELDLLQIKIDITSVAVEFTGVGEPVAILLDVVNANISAKRGDESGFGLSMFSTLPGIGLIGNFAFAARLGDDVIDASGDLAKSSVRKTTPAPDAPKKSTLPDGEGAQANRGNSASSAAGGGGPIEGATRLHPDELATGERLSNQLGRRLKESPHEGAEYIDDLGRSYDALGRPAASKFWNEKQFFKSIDHHLLKSNDFTAIDLTGFTSAQKAAVAAYVDALPSASQARIIRIGF